VTTDEKINLLFRGVLMLLRDRGFKTKLVDEIREASEVLGIDPVVFAAKMTLAKVLRKRKRKETK